MAERSPLFLWRRFLALPNDSRGKTLGVALLVALISALGVSVTSVLLEPRQQAHLDAAREAKLAGMIAALPGLGDLLRETGAETLEAVLVDLASGTIRKDADPQSYDFLAAQSDAARTTALSPEQDIAGIARRPDLAPAYLLRGRDGLALVVLPVYGTGYQSVIRAYLALSADLTTIAGLSIYEQGETPGLGARITDPGWQALWSGKQAVNASGEIVIAVVRGGATGLREIDGISGATRSSMGVARIVQFWLGPDGFGPFLAALRSGEER
ncbi:NADH:ubiquinone reductase (Na(+)-transporting) subunit C [Salipiger sp. 1_MG-2023]|uniref:NADH:ubiquinone reductase (Na(+)-transporting) subunit C n=1 Tax=Salipiger sp. 1_MG-2023 TaxID=3062665 RepID=UPI0026E201D4|nr:NADH:ubiquinone reductase (Na(+)-transporting) subunit C [Salipiger sp. 1_MG-2023]MDO6587836.1 NADH:ubiquinone reductase (Na(+)-transporting) subunit C [Salipiger sp. 1_MG-2023]